MRKLLRIDAFWKTVVGLALLLSPLAQPRLTAAADWTVEHSEWGDCEKDEDCESGLCFPYVAKGPHCTITCTMDSDCPPPSNACSGMGVCKAP